jgi:putative MATE family efflux protein
MGTDTRALSQTGLLRRLLSLSWPLTVSESLGMLVPAVDMVWIGRLGSGAIAGVGIAGTVTMVVMDTVAGLMTGLRASVARLSGSGQHGAAAHILGQAFIVGLLYTAVIAVAGWVFSASLLTVFGLEEAAASQGAAYLRLMAVAAPIFTLRLLAESAMQASGDAITPMKITLLNRLLNAALSPLLVFGLLAFPRLGVTGVAWSAIVAQSVALILGLGVLLAGRTRIRLTLAWPRPAPRDMWRLLRVSAPAAFAFTENDLGGLVIGWIMVPFGTVAVAAHVISNRIQQVLYVPLAGLGMASGILAGQYLGVRRPDLASKTAWMAAGIAAAFGLAAGLVVLLFASPIAGIFGQEPGLITMAAAFARIGCPGYVLIGVVIVFLNCLNGTGDTVPPMAIMFTSMWLIGIPLVLLVPRFADVGVYGLRWLLQSIAVLTAAGMAVYFKAGRWKRRVI